MQLDTGNFPHLAVAALRAYKRVRNRSRWEWAEVLYPYVASLNGFCCETIADVPSNLRRTLGFILALE